MVQTRVAVAWTTTLQTRAYVASYVEQFNVDQTHVRFGLLFFNEIAYVNEDFNYFNAVQSVVKYINSVPYFAGLQDTNM